MKTSIGKRLLSFLLAVVMVLGLVPAVASPKAEAETATTASATTVTKEDIILLRNYAETLGWPVAVKTTGLGASYDMTGHWMILMERSGGQMYTVNMSAPQSINIENNSADPNYLYAVTFVTGSGAVNELHSMPQAHILSFSGMGSSFSVQNYKKQYWYISNINHGGTSTDNTTNYDFTFTSSSSSAATRQGTVLCPDQLFYLLNNDYLLELLEKSNFWERDIEPSPVLVPCPAN